MLTSLDKNNSPKFHGNLWKCFWVITWHVEDGQTDGQTDGLWYTIIRTINGRIKSNKNTKYPIKNYIHVDVSSFYNKWYSGVNVNEKAIKDTENLTHRSTQGLQQ